MKQVGWESRLREWVARRLRQPFEWGRTDCAMLVAEAWDVMTGQAVAECFRGRYATRAQAIRFQRRKASLLGELIDRGCWRVAAPQEGDIIIVQRDGFQCGHICAGIMVLSAWPDLGVGLGNTADALAAPGAVTLRIP